MFQTQYFMITDFHLFHKQGKYNKQFLKMYVEKSQNITLNEIIYLSFKSFIWRK